MSRVMWFSHGVFRSVSRLRRVSTGRGMRSLTAVAFVVPLVLGPGQAAVQAATRAGAPPAPQAYAVTGGTVIKPKKITPHGDPMHPYRPTAVTWPAAVSGTATLAAPAQGHARGPRTTIAGTPIWAQSASKTSAPAGVKVQVAAHKTTVTAGISGALF